jgi:hypothetical protein
VDETPKISTHLLGLQPIDRDAVSDSIRLLVVARQPLRVDDLGLSGVSDVAETQLIRRHLALELAIERSP